ncbi:ROK family protein [Halosimplex carlsbadense 2-9-1]|uniref:ROK family protein n=1 Tax=Halosimplex carlsbadense 2-9-1 TaxID=797114 RepID=M0D862_9EURY|nr:ROK family protein [Halosimplex carlsbadense]ELZ30349.1 ROK family protein [Halosimplex carlsbadense 2-9-1]
MDRVAAFGIGSTNFRAAVATADGTLLTDPVVEPTRPRELADQLAAAVGDLRRSTDRPFDAVAVSTAGLVDDAGGAIREFDTPDGETVDRIAVASAVDRAHGLPVTLVNDCNAAALGEWHYGAREDENCLAHVTFGTGIGGGVVADGRLLRGEDGQAGEFGLLPVAPHDYESTGVTGAWEAVCSGRGIPALAARHIEANAGPADAERVDTDALTAEDVFVAADGDERWAVECLDAVARYNAAGVAAVCNAVNPGVVTLGGGVALHNPDRIVSGIEEHLDRFLFVDRPTIRLTPLGDDIGLYGALAAVGAEQT